MTKSLTTHIETQKALGKLIFIPYIMAGANGLENLQKEVDMLVQSGASVIELGIPFSDPVADGPIIQAAGLKAMANGTTLRNIIKALTELETTVPIVLMGYMNSFHHYGLEKLVNDLEKTPVKGLIIPDLPFEHTHLIKPLLIQSDISLIPLVSLTSSEERIKELIKDGEGFIYAVTINGITGVDKNYHATLDQHLAYIKKVSPVPVLAGFGISTPKDVKRFVEVCDGVIVGSKIVDSLATKGIEATGELVKTLFTFE